MKAFEKKTNTDLGKMLTEKREALRGFRFETAGSKTRDVRAARKARREIARMLTELRMRREDA